MNSRRLLLGLSSGVLATLAMTIVMLVGAATKLSPMPQPIPVALAARILGHGAPKPLLLIGGLTTHLLYGGVAGTILWLRVHRVTLWRGLAWGLALWVLLGLVFLPFLGWGLFGSALTLKIAAATLLLHLVYGSTLGALGIFMSTTQAQLLLAARFGISDQAE